MPDPVTWFVAGLAMKAVDIFVESRQTKAEAEFQEEIAEINIEQAQADIAWVEKQTGKAVERHREAGEEFRGTQRAVIGHSAAKMAGTPLMIMQETQAKIEEDVLAIKEYGAYQVSGYESQIEAYEAGKTYYEGLGKQAWLTGLLGMGSTFLTGYAKFKMPELGWPTFGQRKKTTYEDPWRLGGY